MAPSEPFTKLPPIYSLGSEPSTNQHQSSVPALAAEDYATERAQVLFAAYRRGDANDPDGYVAAIAAVLSLYEPALMREVTDPRTGISQSDYMDGRFRSYMPNSGELKAYCDGIRDRRARYDYLGQLPRRYVPRSAAPLDRSPGRRANVFVHANAPQYARAMELVAGADEAEWKYDPAGRPGIWISQPLLHDLRMRIPAHRAEAAE